MNIFKNRAVQVSLVKTDNADDPTPDVETVNPQEIAQIATDFTIKTIGALGVVIAANRILSTACEIAVIAAKAKFK
jgi:hypothetical protein